MTTHHPRRRLWKETQAQTGFVKRVRRSHQRGGDHQAISGRSNHNRERVKPLTLNRDHQLPTIQTACIYAGSLLSLGLKTEFEAHALQELEHADTLANRIQQLGGVPIFDLQELAGKAASIGVHPEQGTTLVEMVGENLMLERRQVEAYSALIREIGDKDLVTRQLLLDILQTTEQHASELADFLKRSSETRG